jgi:glucosamine--fructose-6-phosphate aminotransferase (isomerizing)
MSIQEFIRQQPGVIATAFDAVERTRASLPADRPLLLVGSGSSFNALTVAAAISPAQVGGMSVIGPAAFLRHAPALIEAARPAVLVLSQSGSSTTSIAAAEAAVKLGAPTLVVTCEPESAIAQLPVARIVLPIGGEPIGPKTKGFTATLAGVLAILSRRDGRDLPPFSPDDFAAFVERSERQAAEWATRLSALDYLVVAGSGRFLGIALEASLKIAEIVGLPTAGFEIEELLHGRLHGLGPKSLCVVIAGNDAELATAHAVKKAMLARDVRVAVLNMTAAVEADDWFQIDGFPPPLDCLAAIVPFQWLAVALAVARGLEPEAMRYPGLSAALAIKTEAPR